MVRPGRLRSRRRFLLAAPAALGAVLAGCAGRPQPPRERPGGPFEPVAPSPSPVAPLAADAAPVVPARSRGTRPLLAGTPLETAVTVTHSGAEGPVLMILGGVHGNEPGGWLAADELTWLEPAAGTLIVLPRANLEAIAGFVRTTDELGDLNRLYPGSATSVLPMERMAAEIVALALEQQVDVLIDLHESWGFYAGRSQNGTAFLGQTVTAGVGPRNPRFVHALVERVNQHISVERDLLIPRDGSPFRRSGSSGRGRSSLSLGGHVPGLTPVLVEMGQEDQPVERRVELHLAVVRAALEELGMV